MRVLRNILLLSIIVFSCSDKDEASTRTYYMGFQNSAPRFDNLDLYLQSLNMWTQRVDAAMITTEVPWAELLSGAKVNDYVIANYKELVNYYRNKGLKLWVYIDPQNGLDRANDAVDLQKAGKSIADADMQLLYQKFTIAMDSILKPDHLGLALETNLIRDGSTAAIYQGVKKAANETAAKIKARNSTVSLSVSIQADHAWGKLIGGSYKGIDQDFIDFPFIQELGISSYPYFGFDKPTDIPVNYYSKLVAGKNIPVFVSEGGWTSLAVNTGSAAARSPEIQKEYIAHHAALLDDAKATAVFQLLFTDLDLDAFSADMPVNLPYFAYLGLVDKNLNPKPALTAWDHIFNNRAKATP